MAFYLGIDGGGTKTLCWVGDESRVLGAGHGAGCNAVRYGEAAAREQLTKAINQACSDAKIQPDQVASACVGTAGAGRAEVAEIVRRIVQEILPARIIILGDMVIALHAAFGQTPGVIVIAGTGSVAYGRDHQGRTARAGGWGPAISDEGSADWIGRRAFAEALRARDEARETNLLAPIMQCWKADSLDDAVMKANRGADFASLVPAIADLEDARHLFKEAGRELASLAAVVVNRLFARGDEVPVATAGGLFKHNSTVCKAFLNSIQTTYPTARVAGNMIEPVAGALELAREALK